ncbi:MAG: NADH-ubiquinone oxidoreductase-F iron-sulfur binding region domain-containing protein, partial [Terriglobia bacterium]
MTSANAGAGETNGRELKVRVGMSTCGVAAGAKDVLDAFKKEFRDKKIQVKPTPTGCLGLCFKEPIVEIEDGGKSATYGGVTQDRVARIISEHVVGGKPVEDWLLFGAARASADAEFLHQQERIVLENAGRINPEDIKEYLAIGGYDALKKALTEMKPEMVIDEITEAGVRGRGGAGFPTGKKWELTRASNADPKYIICNADEGDPGAFMDRSILEGDPHRVLEGMLIAGYAIGAAAGFIYVRAEYPLAVRRLKVAIAAAKKAGFIGDSIFGTDFGFTVEIREGAGAFICGEETALIFSIEGKRGMPRVRPPYPAQAGLWDQPTSINNVETFANVPWIIRNGGERYASVGTEGSKGTKVFSLTGPVKRSGLVEVPMGATFEDIIFDIGGGIQGGGELKAVQIGGPTGGCLPKEALKTPIDYESLAKSGAVVGSGGLVVLDESTCLVDLARFFMNFASEESCGKCVPCRIGTQ